MLRVDPIACLGRGLCAELLPELVGLDEWGYPLLDRNPVPADLVPQARRAITACPTLALRLQVVSAAHAEPSGNTDPHGRHGHHSDDPDEDTPDRAQ